MMLEPSTMLSDALCSGRLPELSLRQWDLLVRQARRANLLARLAVMLDNPDYESGVPAPVRPHLQSALVMARRQDIAIRWEVKCIGDALRGAGVPVVLLKGAAYALAGLPAAHGRLFGDVDILVAKEALPEVESALLVHGWRHQKMDAYDQRYYRRWMHEIPPMEHVRRGTVIDVHHSILPETARIRTNAAALLKSAVPLAGHEGMFVLAPADMILHSATHLFHEGELHNGLRDLLDLESLIRHFSSNPDFWQTLLARASLLGLERPLYYALRYTRELLGAPIPESAVVHRHGPHHPARLLLDVCYRRALRPEHASCDDALTPIARWLLYIRSHWLRMPFPLLVYHLTRKALMARLHTDEDESGLPQQR